MDVSLAPNSRVRHRWTHAETLPSGRPVHSAPPTALGMGAASSRPARRRTRIAFAIRATTLKGSASSRRPIRDTTRGSDRRRSIRPATATVGVEAIPKAGASPREDRYQPPPPPPPEEPPPEPPPPELPDELSEPLDAGEGTDSAMPAAATDHAAAPPAPPDRPPPNPVHSDPAGAEESLDERCDWKVESVDVVVAARSVDQASACSPRPNASTHGYQSSRNAGCGRRSSALKNSRAAVSFLRNATAVRLGRDLMPLIEEFVTHSDSATLAAIISSDRSMSLRPTERHRNAAVAAANVMAGRNERSAAPRPQSIRVRKTTPAIRAMPATASAPMARNNGSAPSVPPRYHAPASMAAHARNHRKLVSPIGPRESPGSSRSWTRAWSSDLITSTGLKPRLR